MLASLIGAALIQTSKTLPDYKMVWSDEFTKAGRPDPKKWDYEVGYIRNNELQYYTKGRRENARVEGGKLIIEGRKEPFQGKGYTAASLITLGKFSFQYGKVEVSAKLPKALGAWPAIWMLGVDRAHTGWPRCGEIDIMEHVNHNPGVIHGTVHMPKEGGGSQSRGGNITDPGCMDNFRVYGMEWTPESIDFYLDGKKYYSHRYAGSATWVYDRPMYLLLNLAIGGTWGGQKGIEPNWTPQRFEVEYVRVYQRDRYR